MLAVDVGMLVADVCKLWNADGGSEDVRVVEGGEGEQG